MSKRGNILLQPIKSETRLIEVFETRNMRSNVGQKQLWHTETN
jgi:hypothetical protein